MNSETSLKKDWEVTPEAFDKLLTWLDPDREAAAGKYEKIRLKLIKLFKWRNCLPEEDYADITIDRVTRRVFENTAVEVRDPYLYFHGTALNVIREFWRGQQKHKQEDLESVELSSESPAEEMDRQFEQVRAEHRRDCMRNCLRSLPDETREFIIEYHQGERKMDVRKQMADRLNAPLNVLRIRACRIRAELDKCVEKCVKKFI